MRGGINFVLRFVEMLVHVFLPCLYSVNTASKSRNKNVRDFASLNNQKVEFHTYFMLNTLFQTMFA